MSSSGAMDSRQSETVTLAGVCLWSAQSHTVQTYPSVGRRKGLLLVEALDLVGFSTDLDLTSQALGYVDILSRGGKCQTTVMKLALEH